MSGASIDLCEPLRDRFADAGQLPLEMCDVGQRQTLGKLDLDEVLQFDALPFRGSVIRFCEPVLQRAQTTLTIIIQIAEGFGSSLGSFFER